MSLKAGQKHDGVFSNKVYGSYHPNITARTCQLIDKNSIIGKRN